MEYVLGVHAIVPARIARRIASARQRASFLEFAGQMFSPHVTIYLCRFTRRAYRQLMNDIRTIRLRRVAMHLERLRVVTNDRGVATVVIQVRRTKALQRLHLAVAASGNRLRDGWLRKKDVLRIRTGEYSTAERQTTVRYGYRGAGERYAPHVTVAIVPKRSGALRQLNRDARNIQGESWIAKRLVFGLYRYNNAAGRYVGQAREQRIRLQ